MPNMHTLRAGVARRTITPLKGIFLIGYGDRTKGNIGVHDELTATALVIESGTKRIAIVALDILTINEFVVDRVRTRLAPIELLLCCSHTHSGPISYASEGSFGKNRAFINSLVENITAAVLEADSKLTPVRLEYGSSTAGIAINRREKMPDGHTEIGRNPQGVVDRSLQVVKVLDESGQLLATLVNYACHGTVLGPDNLLVSADWIGAMRSTAEAELGGMVLFLQGATANLNPDMYWEDVRAFEMVAEQGRSVAEAVVQAVRTGSESLKVNPLLIERSEVWLPTEAQVTGLHPPKNYAKSLLAMAKLPGWMSILADPLLNQRYPWKPRIEARDGYWSVPMRINVVRVGELCLVSFAAETFTEIGMEVKKISPARHTFFTSITDGCISYLHTAESHPEGGYEVDTAPLAYRYPGRLSAACEAIVLEETKVILNHLWE
ncbi:MAG TPA: neutral/alkaline non-lysosomal ceramidase N-terminal domain-containing protein [Anaerolineales bacterium]|nr:neutral/alkaline non-lysosomal ceramidase N-terminal domain-containing protein [Anaerolineales bacterium]